MQPVQSVKFAHCLHNPQDALSPELILGSGVTGRARALLRRAREERRKEDGESHRHTASLLQARHKTSANSSLRDEN